MSPETQFVRRNAWMLPPGDETLHFYGVAVAAMKAREPQDPTSWSYQAGIHGSEKEVRALFNECKHGSWFFLAWHRMFVYYFERIVREAVIAAGGPADWALPYWNYSLGGQQATMPVPFRASPTAIVNPLYVGARAKGINEGHALPAAAASDTYALSRPVYTGIPEFGGGEAPPNQQFWSQTGRVEQTPHNDVHNAIGGPTGLMANPDTAAQDPIFWLHHSNIDRIWAVWNAQGKKDPEAPKWTEQTFKFFDVGGKPAEKTCAEVISTDDLEYTYDTLAPPAAVAAIAVPAAVKAAPGEPEVIGANDGPVVLTGQPASTTVAIDQAAVARAATAGEPGGPTAYLGVEEIDGERNPGTVYGVYLDLPAEPNEQVLRERHVGNVSFFGLERARNPREGEQAHKLRVSMDISHVLAKLHGTGEWDGQALTVDFRPLRLVPPPGEAEVAETEAEAQAPVQIGRVSVSLA
jgi:tyrosinase